MAAALKPDSDGAERLASSTIRRQRNGLLAFHQAQSWKRVEQRVQTAMKRIASRRGIGCV
jgi:hypothetical protein